MSWYCERCGPVDEHALAAAGTYRAQPCPRCGQPLALARPLDQSLAFACPDCHAEVDARASRCGECGRWFGTPRCARCRGAVDPDTGRCGECRAPAAPTSGATAVLMRLPCPVCDAELSRRAFAGSEAQDVALECPLCRGMMVEHAVVDRWTADRAARAPGDEALLAAVAPPEQTAVRYRRCPRCAAVMNRTNFAPGSGVIVDACRAHGMWFDPGELGRVIAFARSGRLEQARRRRAAEAAEAKRRDAAAAGRASSSVASESSWEARGHARRSAGGIELVAALVRWLLR